MFPVDVVAAGVDKIWFGVFVAVMVELAAVSPPVGITVAYLGVPVFLHLILRSRRSVGQ